MGRLAFRTPGFAPRLFVTISINPVEFEGFASCGTHSLPWEGSRLTTTPRPSWKGLFLSWHIKGCSRREGWSDSWRGRACLCAVEVRLVIGRRVREGSGGSRWRLLLWAVGDDITFTFWIPRANMFAFVVGVGCDGEA